jgi:hypothetical protein
MNEHSGIPPGLVGLEEDGSKFVETEVEVQVAGQLG